MDPLTMFSCPFRHDTTLQQHRLPSYGKRYEVEGRTNFLERRTGEVRRTHLLRRWVNKGKKKAGALKDPDPLPRAFRYPVLA
jgi:hypothetical protein